MSYSELKALILVLICVDVAVIIFNVFVIRKLRLLNKAESFEKAVRMFESLVKSADRTGRNFKEQLKAKQTLARKLDSDLESKMRALNALLSRADTLLDGRKESGDLIAQPNNSSAEQKSRIVALAKQGLDTKEIGRELSISKGEVDLVLDLNRKFSELEQTESQS